MAQDFPEWAGDLDSAYTHIVFRLHRAGAGDDKGLRWMSFATTGPHSAPNVRTVALRGYDDDTARAVFFTDTRAQKVADLEGNPACSALFYDHDTKVQVRFDAMGTIHFGDDVAKGYLDQLKDSQLLDYSGYYAPGHKMKAADMPYSEDPRDHFAVCVMQVRALEWLQLGREGHRRALYNLGPEGDVAAQSWIAP